MLGVTLTLEPLLWDTSIQGTPPHALRGHKIWSLKNVHIIFEFATSIKGSSIQGKGTLFLGLKTWV